MSKQAGIALVAPRHPLDRRAIAALVLLVLAIIFVGIAMSPPWWIRSSSNGITQTSYLTDGCSDGMCVSYQGFPPLRDMFGLTDTLVLAGLVLSLVTVAMFILSLFRPRAGMGVLVSGVSGAVLLLAAPAYMFFALPGTMSIYSPYDRVNGFFGSCAPSGSGFGCTTAESWGGGTGWFTAMAAFVVFLLATVIAFFVLRRLERGP